MTQVAATTWFPAATGPSLQLMEKGQKFALPILEIFDPTYRAIEVVENSNRAYQAIRQGARAYRLGNSKQLFTTTLQTALSTSLAVGFIFWYSNAFITTVSIDLASCVKRLATGILKRDGRETLDAFVDSTVNILYLTVEVLTGPEVQRALVISLLCRDLLIGYRAMQKENNVRSLGYFTRLLVRMHLNQALFSQVRSPGS